MKVKTHKATKKRFKLTANKKVLHYSQGDNSHLKANKDRGRKQGKRAHFLPEGDRKKYLNY
jgi:ribosomal protein L35